MSTVLLATSSIILLVLCIILCILYYIKAKEHRQIYLQYKDVVDLDREMSKRNKEIAALKMIIQKEVEKELR